jgi:predicted short-subunit dehydrogenase-like oxidoreductase (DUF2520 family)
MQEFHDIVLIGSGNVAGQLAYALEKAGKKIVQVYSRTETSARQLAGSLNTEYTIDLNQICQKADLYIISLTDTATGEISTRLDLVDKPVVHTSGSLSLDLLCGVSINHGVFYPLQTFSKNRKVNFREIPLCVEANSTVFLKMLRKLAGEMSERVLEVDSERRKMLHLAAVFACNFTNFMYYIAGKIVERNDFDFEVLRPLIEETAKKVMKDKPQKTQTGPAIRGDQEVMGLHMDRLMNEPELQEIYRLLSREIGKMKI